MTKNVDDIGHLLGFRWAGLSIERTGLNVCVFKLPTNVNKTYRIIKN